MNEQVLLLLKVVRRELEVKRNRASKSSQRGSLLRLMLGVMVGATTRALYEVVELGEPLDLMSLMTAIASAVVILSFWRGLVHWLDEATPCWTQLLLGFSVGLLGQIILKELVEGVK